jgi:hypothetical protein
MDAFHHVFLIFGVIVMIGIIPSVLRPKVQKGPLIIEAEGDVDVPVPEAPQPLPAETASDAETSTHT